MNVAIVRPESWNLPLFVHVLGAMVLVGALVFAAGSLVAARGGGSAELTRLGFRALLVGAVPAFIVMRVGAQWIESESGYDDEAAWIGLGYIASDMGLLLLIGATILAWRAVKAGGRAGGGTAARVATGLTGFLLLMYVVVIWAMTTKPD